MPFVRRSILPLAVVAAVLMLGGCVTSMVREDAPRKGPIAAVGYINPGGGEIRYSTQGWSFVLAARRRAAFYRMRRFCKGMGLKIVDEFTHQDADAPYHDEDLETDAELGLPHYVLANYHHIVFQCVPLPTPSGAAAPVSGNAPPIISTAAPAATPAPAGMPAPGLPAKPRP